MTGDPTTGRSSASRVGSRFGPYVLKRLLGAGGFGEVYEAEDTTMHRVVALKLLSSSYSHNPAFRERLFREARTAGRLHDAHVVPIHRCGEIDGQLYIDMRMIDGTDLQSAIDRGGAMVPARAVAIVRQIASALDAAHAETVIHRDVKPANILLGGNDFACLVDFGLANAATDTKLTSEGTTIGSFAYLAPERLAAGHLTPGADIYALACVLYECLTGSPPYADRQEIPSLVAAHLAAPVPRPSQHRPGIPGGFDEVIARGMAKEPQDRYPTAGALAAAAQQALKTPVLQHNWAPQAAPTTQPWTPRQPSPPTMAGTQVVTQPSRSRSRRTILTVAAVGVIAAIALTVGIVATTRQSQPSSGTSGATGTSSTRPPPSTATRPAAPPLNATPLPVIGSLELGGVAVGANGDVYVVDSTAPRVLKLAANTNAPTELPMRGIVKPKLVAVSAAGDVFVTDWNTSSAGRVWKLTVGAAAPIELPFGKILPAGVAVDSAGTVYVATREKVLQLGVNDTGPGVLPFGSALFENVALDPAGNVYAVQPGRILKLTPGAASPTQLPFTQLGKAEGAAIDPQGNVYVIDNADIMGKLVKLPAGATSSTVLFAPENLEFGGVAVDSAGAVYLTEGKRLLKIAPS